MNWISKILKSNFFKVDKDDPIGAVQAFLKGSNIWNDVVLNTTGELNHTKSLEALNYFDKAIEYGFKEPEVFLRRGSCLNDLGYYVEALEDYNKGIASYPTQGIANNYFMRSIIKETLWDYEGSLRDIQEAIRLSKLDNDDNNYWNQFTQESIGYNTATEYLEFQESLILRQVKINRRTEQEKEEHLKSIKRRDKSLKQ